MSKNNWRNVCSGDGQGENDMGGTVSTEMFEYNGTWTLSHFPGWTRHSNLDLQDNSVIYDRSSVIWQTINVI